MSDTVYIKISQSTEVHEPEVRVKDIAQVHCRNKAAEARIKALKVTSFKERDGRPLMWGASWIFWRSWKGLAPPSR